jgi:hypothetical protein
MFSNAIDAMQPKQNQSPCVYYDHPSTEYHYQKIETPLQTRNFQVQYYSITYCT